MPGIIPGPTPEPAAKARTVVAENVPAVFRVPSAITIEPTAMFESVGAVVPATRYVVEESTSIVSGVPPRVVTVIDVPDFAVTVPPASAARIVTSDAVKLPSEAVVPCASTWAPTVSAVAVEAAGFDASPKSWYVVDPVSVTTLSVPSRCVRVTLVALTDLTVPSACGRTTWIAVILNVPSDWRDWSKTIESPTLSVETATVWPAFVIVAPVA